MKKYNFLLAVIIFSLLLITNVKAIGLEYYGIEDSIQDDNSVTHEVTLKFDKPISHLDYNLAFKIYNLTAESNFDVVDCKVTDRGGKSQVSCDFVGMTREKNLLILNFITRDSVKRSEGKLHFIVNYGISLPIERTVAKIRLPPNGILSEDVINQSYSPQDGSVFTDGRHIIVSWEEFNLTSGDNLQFSVSYKKPAQGILLPNWLIVLLTVIIIIAMIGIAVYMRRGVEPQVDVIASVLNEDEKKVVDVIKAHNDSVGQKIIVRETGFSKAKVSRLINSLKKRNVIIIEPISGRENRIILKTKES